LNEPQDLVRVDSAEDPEAEFNHLIGALLSLAPPPQDVVSVALDSWLDDEGAAMMESILVDSDDEIWGR